jgi:spore germination cell wall hydrolase CwlJ-like protein
VAQVVLNRVNDDGFPDNVCDVVTQGPIYKSNPDLPVRHMCQFSFYCDGKSDDPKDHKSWDKAKYLSWRVMHNQSVDISDGALYYHADYVAPKWSITKEKTIRINKHVFYR